MTKTILIGIVLILLGAILFVRGREGKTPKIEHSDPVSQMLETKRPAKPNCRQPQPVHIAAATLSANNSKPIPWTNPCWRNAG
ncbi:MAG TPA: hypothetical protein VFC44_07360 [Candidatus Saccharimonadales bacterium]|nr:hypothetical protein [Candidatus Saccharimonadales bacterium]